MMRFRERSLVFLLLSMTMPGVQAEDAPADAHGEEVHRSHCYKCHTDSVYTREDRFVKSLDALSKQVVRCRDANDIPWYDEDTEAVVRFLNSRYYRF